MAVTLCSQTTIAASQGNHRGKQGQRESLTRSLERTDEPRAYVKFFDELKVTPKRIARTKWLIEQRIDNWAPELRGAPNSWLDTQSVGGPAGDVF